VGIFNCDFRYRPCALVCYDTSVRNLVIVMVFLTLIAGGMFFYQVQKEREELSPTPTVAPSRVPSSTTSPTAVPSKNITVSSPMENQTVSGSFTISGTARVFENVVSIRVTDTTTKKVLLQTTAYATAPDAGQFGPFALRFDIPKTVKAGDIIRVEVYQASPKDGSEVDTVSVLVRVR